MGRHGVSMKSVELSIDQHMFWYFVILAYTGGIGHSTSKMFGVHGYVFEPIARAIKEEVRNELI